MAWLVLISTLVVAVGVFLLYWSAVWVECLVEPGEYILFCPVIEYVNYCLFNSEHASDSYQTFLNHYPISRYQRDGFQWRKFGNSDSRLPAMMARADWFIPACPGFIQCPANAHMVPGHRRTHQPKSVYVNPSHDTLLQLADLISGLKREGVEDRVIIFGGTDFTLSRAFGSEGSVHAPLLVDLREVFKGGIYYEAKDIEIRGIKAAPMGLTEMYMRSGIAKVASESIFSASLARKSKGVLAAWGTYTPRLDWMPYRSTARAWVRSAAAVDAGVEERSIDPHRWWIELKDYRFMISPPGHGVQSAKAVEALFVLTIPIVLRTPASADLLSYGFPLVTLETWEDVHIDNLTVWWSDLSPRLETFRLHCLTTDAWWRLFTGQVSCY